MLTPGHSVDSACYYLEEDGVPSATLSLGDRSHTLFGSSPLTVIH